MTATVSKLRRYPVKGLPGESLNAVTLESGQGFPGDREFGFARPNSGFDPANPEPLPKIKFYMLAKDAELSQLDTVFDPQTRQLMLSAAGNSGQFEVSTEAGRAQASRFMKDFLSLPEDETPELFSAYPHRFTDVSVDSVAMMNAVSIINLDSVQEFSRAIACEVDPERFRGNIQVSGLPAFTELDSVGRLITIGSVKLKIVRRTRRCPATEVNLQTGERDMKPPRLLREHYGHMDMGVYAEVLEGGIMTTGDVVTLEG